MFDESAFKADRNHIHHLLLDIAISQIQRTTVLIAVKLLFIILVYQLQGIGTLRLFLLFVFSILTAIIYYIRSQSKSSSKSSWIQNSY